MLFSVLLIHINSSEKRTTPPKGASVCPRLNVTWRSAYAVSLCVPVPRANDVSHQHFVGDFGTTLNSLYLIEFADASDSRGCCGDATWTRCPGIQSEVWSRAPGLTSERDSCHQLCYSTVYTHIGNRVPTIKMMNDAAAVAHGITKRIRQKHPWIINS